MPVENFVSEQVFTVEGSIGVVLLSGPVLEGTPEIGSPFEIPNVSNYKCRVFDGSEHVIETQWYIFAPAVYRTVIAPASLANNTE